MGETPIHACHSCGTTRRLRSQQKAPGQGLGCSELRRQPSGSMARPAYRRPSRDKAGPRVYARALTGSIAPAGTQETRMKRVSWIWYRGGDSNPYSLWPLPPQGSVSTNSTTSAKRVLLLLRRRRHVDRINRRLLLFEHRNIFDQRLVLLDLQHRRIRQASLANIISFFFSKES